MTGAGLDGRDADWLRARIDELDATADRFSVSHDEVRMVLARRRADDDVVPVFEVLVIDQHGKPYIVGGTGDGRSHWKADGMAAVDPVSRHYTVADLREALLRRTVVS